MRTLFLTLRMLTPIAALATLSHAGVLTFPPVELSPVSGDLAGYDGDTVTWGVSLMNNDPNGYWWVITGVTSDYTLTGTPGEIPAGSSFFTDLLSPYFFMNFFLNGQALAPNQDLNLSSPGSPVDVASFQISAIADPGTMFGQLHIFYDIWDSNPFDPNNSSANQIGSAQFDAETSVTALGAPPVPPAAAPEPAGTWLVAGALTLIALNMNRKRADQCR
jgi:hypothetical protein